MSIQLSQLHKRITELEGLPFTQETYNEFWELRNTYKETTNKDLDRLTWEIVEPLFKGSKHYMRYLAFSRKIEQ